MYPMVEITADPAAGVSIAEARDVCREALIEAREALHLPQSYRIAWLDMPRPGDDAVGAETASKRPGTERLVAPAGSHDAAAARLKLESAERQLQLAETRFKSGQTTVLEVLRTGLARDLAEAELHGSLLEAANARAQYTKGIFDVLQAQYRQGMASAEEVTKAKLDRDLAAMDVRGLAGMESMKFMLSSQAQSEAGKAAAKKAAPRKPTTEDKPEQPRKWQGIVLTYEAEPGSARPGARKQQLAESLRAWRQELTDLIHAVDRRVNSGPQKVARVNGNLFANGRLEIQVALQPGRCRPAAGRAVVAPPRQPRVPHPGQPSRQHYRACDERPEEVGAVRFHGKAFGLVGACQGRQLAAVHR